MNVDLLQGDCLELMNTIPDKSVDMVLCDLPYGVTACKWDTVLPFDDLWRHYNRITKDNGAIVLFGTEPFASQLRVSNIENYKYDFIWRKTKAGNFALCRKNPMKYHENIMVFYRQFPTYNLWNLRDIKPIKSSRKNKGGKLGHCVDDGGYYQTKTGFHGSILEFSNKSGKTNSYHPTQKPVELLEYLIKTYTNQGEKVLDNCMGSGSTGVACCNTNRDFIGIELDKNYFSIATKRIQEAQQTLKLL